MARGTGAVIAVAVALGATPPAAHAVGACEKTGAVLSVTQNGHEDRIGLRVDAGTIVVTSSSASPHTCTGGTPTVANIDAIVVSDNSDNPATGTADDGSISITVSNAGAFTSGGDPIEMVLNFKQGFDDHFRLIGGPGPDTFLLGDAGADPNGAGTSGGLITLAPPDSVLIESQSGDDLVSAQGGGSASDPYDGPGVVEVVAGPGDDTVRGTSRTTFPDVLRGGADDDTVQGFGGNDVLHADAGDDTLDGGAGEDTITFEGFSDGVSADLAIAGPQDTVVAGNDAFVGVEHLVGGSGDDRLFGDGAANNLLGAFGDDVLGGREGPDLHSGQDGFDTVDLSDQARALTVDLPVGFVVDGGVFTDSLSQVEAVVGTAFADRFVGTDGPETFTGGPGQDTVDARGGTDTVLVRDGEGDTVACGDGLDSVQADRRSLDTLTGCELIDALPEPVPPAPPGGGPPLPGVPAPPTASRDTALDFRLTGARTQRLLRQRAIVVRAQCRLEACTTTASAAGTLPRVPRIGSRRLRIARRTARNPSGAARTLRLPLSARQRTAIRRALAARRRVRILVTVVAVDAAGNRVTRTLRVTARR